MQWLASNRSGIIYTILIIFGVLVAAYSLASIGQETLTPRESNLLAVSLTLASLFLSWVITTLYHNAGFSRSMRDKDVQRANMIQSIKQQMQLLREWNRIQLLKIAGQNEQGEYHCDHVNEILVGIDCQFDAMIKEIGGNIGDADRQATELLTSVRTFGREIKVLESEKQMIEAESEEAESSEHYDVLQKRIQDIIIQQESLKDTMASVLTQDDTPNIPARQLQPIELDCPECHHANRVQMAGFTGETRTFTCEDCLKIFNAHCTAPGRFISRRFSTFNGVGSPQARFAPIQRDAISPPGFDFSPEEFSTVSGAIIDIYRPFKWTLKTLTEALSAELEPRGYTKSRIGKLLQMLYWGRIFEFGSKEEGQSQSTVIIRNDAITLDDIGRGFFRSLGYRMASVKLSPLKEVQDDVSGFVASANAELDVAVMAAQYMEGRAAAASAG